MREERVVFLTDQRASLQGFLPLPTGAEQYSLAFIEQHGVIKLRESSTEVVVGITDPQREDLVNLLIRYHPDKKLKVVWIEKSELLAHVADNLSRSLESGVMGSGEEALSLDELASDAPVINLVNKILIEALRHNASDVHIEGFSKDMRVRYRLDGVLHTVGSYPPHFFQKVSVRIKVMARLNIMEKRLPQEGRVTLQLEDQLVDVRVSIVPITGGESIVLRLFPSRKRLFSLSELGLTPSQEETLRKVLKAANGMVLLSGPTGSGKTTTLNALLRELPSDELKIITIEDPVEYELPGVVQIQTNEQIGLTFGSILRRVLRQDPDVIMVGEIRDEETAHLAVRAALTGHLVFSTVHTRDTPSVITRLFQMGVTPFLLSSVLRCIVAQRLVRRLCGCKREVSPPPWLEEMGAARGITFSRYYEPSGCELCLHTGYHQRIGIFEVAEIDATLQECILRMRDEKEIRDYLKRRGDMTLLDVGLTRVAEGITSYAEIERVLSL